MYYYSKPFTIIAIFAFVSFHILNAQQDLIIEDAKKDLHEYFMAKNELLALSNTNTPKTLLSSKEKRVKDAESVLSSQNYTPQQTEDAINELLDGFVKDHQTYLLPYVLSFNPSKNIDRRKNVAWVKKEFLGGNYLPFYASYIVHNGTEGDLDALRTVMARLPDKNIDPPQRPEDLKTNDLVIVRGQIRGILAEAEYKRQHVDNKNESLDEEETPEALHKSESKLPPSHSVKQEPVPSSSQSNWGWAILLLSVGGFFSGLVYLKSKKGNASS